MSRTIHILRTALMLVTGMALLWPTPVHSQQGTAFSGNTVGNPDAVIARFVSLMQAAKPAAPNPFQQPWSVNRNNTSEHASSDSLGLQVDRSWTTALAQYAFTAPPGFYAFDRNQAGASDWDSALSGAVTAYLSRSYTTYLRVSGDFEVQGQQRQPGGTGEPGVQIFTAEFETAYLVPSKFGPLEIAAGTYQQRLVSYSAFANSPLTTPFLGYSGSAAGFETSFTLPDKNITISFRNGIERPNATGYKAHATQFEFSWTW